MHPTHPVVIMNLLILAVLSVWFVVTSFDARRERALSEQFIGGSGRLRVGSGTISLLAFWITGNTLMAAPESTYQLGVLGSIGYALIGGTALVAFAPLAVRIRRVVPHGRTIGDFFIRRFGRSAFLLLLLAQLVYGLGVLVTQGVAGEVALHDILGIPHALGLAILLVVTSLYAGIGGFASIVRVGFSQVFIMLTVAVVVPTVIILKLGIHDVFWGIERYHPAALKLSSPEGIEFIYSGIVMGIGEVFMDNAFWQRTFSIRRKNVNQSFIIGGLVWMMVPLSMSTLAFVALAQGINTPIAGSIAPTVALAVGGWFAGTLIFLGVWAAVTSTIGGFLNSIVAVLLHDVVGRITPQVDDKRLKMVGRIATFVIAALVYLVCLWKPFSMIGTLTFLGVLNAAFISPIIFGLFGRRLSGDGAFIASLLAMLTGYGVYAQFNSSFAILTSFFVSLFISFVSGWLKPSKFTWEGLRSGPPNSR